MIETGDSRGTKFAALVVSVIVPGGGQVLRGDWRRGLLWFVGIGVLFAMLPVVGATGLAVALIARLVGSPVDAALMKPGHQLGGGARALVIVAMVGAMVAATIGVRLFLIEGFRIPSGAMSPNLAIGDYFFVDKRARTPAVGDVVVFTHPPSGHDFIMRVIALGGDRVEVRNSQPIRNGTAANHGAPQPCTFDDRGGAGWTSVTARCVQEALGKHRYQVVINNPDDDHGDFGETTVPAGHVFVLGDNRPNSNDSRFWGTVPLANIRGTATFIWMSRGPAGFRWPRFGKAIP